MCVDAAHSGSGAFSSCRAQPQPPPSSPSPALSQNTPAKDQEAGQSRGHRRARKTPKNQVQHPGPATHQPQTAAPWPGATAGPQRPKTKGDSTTLAGGRRIVTVLLTVDEGAHVPPSPESRSTTGSKQNKVEAPDQQDWKWVSLWLLSPRPKPMTKNFRSYVACS